MIKINHKNWEKKFEFDLTTLFNSFEASKNQLRKGKELVKTGLDQVWNQFKPLWWYRMIIVMGQVCTRTLKKNSDSGFSTNAFCICFCEWYWIVFTTKFQSWATWYKNIFQTFYVLHEWPTFALFRIAAMPFLCKGLIYYHPHEVSIHTIKIFRHCQVRTMRLCQSW